MKQLTPVRDLPRHPVPGEAARVDGWPDKNFRVIGIVLGLVDVMMLNPGSALRVNLRGIPVTRVHTTE